MDELAENEKVLGQLNKQASQSLGEDALAQIMTYLDSRPVVKIVEQNPEDHYYSKEKLRDLITGDNEKMFFICDNLSSMLASDTSASTNEGAVPDLDGLV